MKRLILAALAITATLTATAAAPKVIAHRGFWQTDGSAQNSIASLVKADSIGCYGSEFDVWLTADNRLVVNHNRDINGNDIETGHSTLLLKEKLPNGETLPTLEQYLDAARDLKVELILEVKPHRDSLREDIAVPMIIDMVARKGLTHRTTYITFSRHAFDLLVQQSGRPVYFLTAIPPARLHEARGTGPDYNIGAFRRNPQWFAEFRDLDMPVNVWTITKPTEVTYCIAHDVDYITTDIPDQALRIVAEQCAPRDITVMTYNLHAGADATVEAIAKTINDCAPDFVALQEIDAYTRRANAPQHNGRNFIVDLAHATGMFPVYGSTLNFAGGYYGIGILSKHPCVEARTIELPNPKGYEPRALLEGTFAVDGIRKITFASTHLCVEDTLTRNEQARFIADRYATSQYPVILGGDFNSRPDSTPVTVIQSVLRNVSGELPTFPVEEPRDRLDYIFASPDITPATHTVVVPGGEPPESDHLPVKATARF